MPRDPTTVRFSSAERRLLEAAAERQGETRGAWIREAAVERSVEVLEEELEELRPERETRESGGAS